MANRRMFSREVTESDSFLDMPLSSQALYFHLGMVADDDGFVSGARRVQRTIGATDDDMRLLLAKRFLLSVGDGLVVVKHWKINNYIPKDRYHKTVYTEQAAMLTVRENRSYALAESGVSAGHAAMDTTCIQPVYNLDTQNRIDKNRLEENRVGECREVPTLAQVQSYVEEKGYSFPPERFFNYYSAIHWRKGGETIDWRATADYWQSTQKTTHTDSKNDSEYSGSW